MHLQYNFFLFLTPLSDSFLQFWPWYWVIVTVKCNFFQFHHTWWGFHFFFNLTKFHLTSGQIYWKDKKISYSIFPVEHLQACSHVCMAIPYKQGKGQREYQSLWPLACRREKCLLASVPPTSNHPSHPESTTTIIKEQEQCHSFPLSNSSILSNLSETQKNTFFYKETIFLKSLT